MRQKRAKAYKKLMSLYHMSFGFREPYQVLVDSEFCSTSTSFKLDIVKQFANVLHGNVKPMITQCSIVELYKLGPNEQHTVDLAKTFERRKCNHKEAIQGDDCIASVVGDTNKHRYLIACQSQALRTRLRAVPGVPVIHLNRSVLVLEPASEATLEAQRQGEERALLPSAPERTQLAATAAADAAGTRTELTRKRKRPKGPNPLSVKQKKARKLNLAPTTTARAGMKKRMFEESYQEGDGATSDGGEGSGKPKRKRRRKNTGVITSTEYAN